MSSDTPTSITIKEQRNIPLNQITVSEENVRKTDRSKDVEKLQESIKKFGLIQPIVVIEDGANYKLIVGQRRYLAFKNLQKTSIPALIIKPLNRKLQQIVSFGENIHRRSLPYTDTIELCKTLFKDYQGMTKTKRISAISDDLGISTSTVSKYLAADLIPDDIKKLVEERKLNRDLAYEITSAHYPNVKKITTIVGHVTRLTKEERNRVADYGSKNPSASTDQILDYARKPPRMIKLTIHIEHNLNSRLEKLSNKQNTTVSGIVKDAINKYLDEEE